MRPLMIRAALGIIVLFAGLTAAKAEDRVWKVMAVGDSITEGGTTFSNWRYPLWEKLTAAGYFIEYVGSRGAASRIGTLQHEGYGGQNVEYLATQLQTTFPQNPADIVLLHAGHNYSSETETNLVPRMLTATESIIATCRATNPQVTILLAQVIPSLKLPKYSYIPDFNAALPALAARLSTVTSRVIIVDQATGFDPAADTVADLVHPNASGAAKMRDRWFDGAGSNSSHACERHHTAAARGIQNAGRLSPPRSPRFHSAHRPSLLAPGSRVFLRWRLDNRNARPVLRRVPPLRRARLRRDHRGLSHLLHPRGCHRIRFRGRCQIRHPLSPCARHRTRHRSAPHRRRRGVRRRPSRRRHRPAARAG